MKFGGTSVEDAQAFRRVAEIVAARRDEQPVVVVSAMSRMTDALLAAISMATEGNAAAAVRMLDEHLARHTSVAEELLMPQSSTEVEAELAKVRAELRKLFDEVATHKDAPPSLQDEIVSYGERLSEREFEVFVE